MLRNVVDVREQSNRLSTNTTAANELMSTRPIVKTDAYSGASIATNHGQQQPHLQQHSQNHRPLNDQALNQQAGPGTAATSHIVPSHLDASGTHQAQYYTPSSTSRDPSAAAAAIAASAYHGYIPGGHSVIDTSRYHMTSQQMPDHGYMASPGQNSDVTAAASVIHQQGVYNDATSAGGTVASSAYLAAQAGSTLSPSANIPVTGAGPPQMASVPYLQHSQYPPPPYSNPYNPPQPNQAPPPQSSHGYTYGWYV